MKALLFGANGQIGTELRAAWNRGELLPVTRKECDLRDVDAIRRTIRNASPEVILNAAAYTAVDRAETEIDECFVINAKAPEVMAEEAKRRGAVMVHYSTDYVFDGRKETSYLETDDVHPLNQYGRSKLEGESNIQTSGAHHLILRTSWVFSPHGQNFVKTMLRLGRERDRLRVVDDQVGSPTSAAAIARATTRILREGKIRDEALGLYHMTASGSTSWCGFAREIFLQGGLEREPVVEAIGSEEYPTPAQRPRNSCLSNDKFASRFGFRLPDWREQLGETLGTLTSSPALNHKEKSHRH